MSRLLLLVAFIALIGFATIYVLRGGWNFWTYPAASLVVGGVLAGFVSRRRRRHDDKAMTSNTVAQDRQSRRGSVDTDPST